MITIVHSSQSRNDMSTTIILKNEISEVQQLKAVMREYGKSHYIDQEVIQDVNLVFEEAVSNIIFYGYEDAEAHQVEVRIAISEGLLCVEIQDDAMPYNPLETPEPDLEIPFEDREIGGMGVHLMRSLMDELAYKREGEHNVLLMKKRITHSSGGN